MARETWVLSQVEAYQRLDASLLNTQHYKVRIKGKVEQSREGVAPSPTPWCCSYRKGSLRVTLDYGCQLYLYINYRYHVKGLSVVMTNMQDCDSRVSKFEIQSRNYIHFLLNIPGKVLTLYCPRLCVI